MVLLVMIGSLCLILTIKPESGHVLRNFSTNIVSKQLSSAAKESRICKIEEIVNGRWVNDRPLKSLEEMKTRYGLAVSYSIIDCNFEPRDLATDHDRSLHLTDSPLS